MWIMWIKKVSKFVAILNTGSVENVENVSEPEATNAGKVQIGFMPKYSGETRPELWLADYRLACHLGGTDDDNLIIRNRRTHIDEKVRRGYHPRMRRTVPQL